MATSQYLSPNGYKSEQDLLNDLNAEVISMHGHDFFYIPRDTVNVDELRLLEHQELTKMTQRRDEFGKLGQN